MNEAEPESEYPHPYREVVDRDALGKIMPPTEFHLLKTKWLDCNNNHRQNTNSHPLPNRRLDHLPH
ncbi:MAG: hypothetical protein VX607_01080 [Planctomycetota bacterium]|nr:hypothetical protein [Planctomycetota bacterium]MEE3032453.1 hypothetical protein [Planctomycetota bacterium]